MLRWTLGYTWRQDSRLKSQESQQPQADKIASKIYLSMSTYHVPGSFREPSHSILTIILWVPIIQNKTLRLQAVCCSGQGHSVVQQENQGQTQAKSPKAQALFALWGGERKGCKQHLLASSVTGQQGSFVIRDANTSQVLATSPLCSLLGAFSKQAPFTFIITLGSKCYCYFQFITEAQKG